MLTYIIFSIYIVGLYPDVYYNVKKIGTTLIMIFLSIEFLWILNSLQFPFL